MALTVTARASMVPEGVACLGIVCGLGAWTVALAGLLIVLALLFVGGPLEARLHRRWSTGRDEGK